MLGATLLSWPLFRVVDRANLIMIYLLGVAWVAYRHGRIPALVASAASVLAFDFFFVPPYLTFSVSDTQYLFTFAAMLGVGILISTIADRLRRQNEQMRRREDAPADALPAEPGTLRDPGAAAAARDRTAAPRGVLPGAHRADHARRGRAPSRSPPGTPRGFAFDDNERAVALWVLDNAKIAGAGTDTLGGARGLYVPLRGAQSTVGVLGILPDAGAEPRPTRSRSGCSRPSRASSAARSRARG